MWYVGYACLWITAGNVLVGLGEAWYMRRRGVPVLGRVGIASNYASALAGALLLGLEPIRFLRDQGFEPLYYAGWVILAFWLAAFVLTIAVEFPFIWWSVRGKSTPRAALSSLVLANVASYALLLVIALSMDTLGLVGVPLVQPKDIRPDAGWVYFGVGPRLFRVRLEGGAVEFVANQGDPGHGTTANPDEDGRGAVLEANGLQPVPVGRASQAALAYEGSTPWLARAYRPSDVRRVALNYWGGRALRLQGQGRRYWLATPFWHEGWSYPTVLPSGLILAELEGRIVLFDPKRPAVAILAHGVTPSALLDDRPERKVHFLTRDRAVTTRAELRPNRSGEPNPERPR